VSRSNILHEEGAGEASYGKGPLRASEHLRTSSAGCSRPSFDGIVDEVSGNRDF
jgi:hypothetical protein